MSNLSKIVIAIRDYQYKLLRREFRFESDEFNSYEVMNVELFSEEMSEQYFAEHFSKSPNLIQNCRNILSHIIIIDQSKYKYPPYVLFLITQIVSDDIVDIQDDLGIEELIEKINDLDRILIEFLNREYGKKDYISLGIGIKDQLAFLIDLAYKTLGSFNESDANRIIKNITKEQYTEAFFEKLKDHPYLLFEDVGSNGIFDFKFDFLRDHLRSIKIYNNIYRADTLLEEYDIEIIAAYLTPQSILYKLLAERLKKKSHKQLYAYIKKIINHEIMNINENDFDFAISNLFMLALELKGKNKSAKVYTEVMKEIFLNGNTTDISNLRLIDCPHGLGITFNFSDLIIYNSKIDKYSRFFECNFNRDTYFWSNCSLTNLNYDHINIHSIKCSTINFDEDLKGDSTHHEVILKKDSSYSVSQSLSMNSTKNFVSCLIFLENRSKFSKFNMQTTYLRDKKFSSEDFEIVFNEFLKTKIINKTKSDYALNKSHLSSLSKFFDNSYMSKEINSIFKELKKHYS